jgi:hypothetical protein
VDQVPAAAESETKPLLTKSDTHASHGTIASQTVDSLSGHISRTISGYFSNSKYEQRIREALDEIENLESRFDESIQQELRKVNAFYFERMDELNSRLSVLVESVVEEYGTKGGTPAIHHRRKRSLAEKVVSRFQRKPSLEVSSKSLGADAYDHKPVHISHDSSADPFIDDPVLSAGEDYSAGLKASDSIQRAMTDMYRTAKLLHNFAIMNYTGFVKIVKKHDKTFKEHKGRFKKLTIESEVCSGGKDVGKLEERMERLYADWFCDGNLLEGRAQLLPKRGDGLQMDWSQLRLGYRLGMCAVLTIWVCWDCIWGFVAHNESTIGGRTAFPVFRALGGLVLLHWFWGISTYVWTRYRVNYIFLFDFNPNIVESPIGIFNDAVDETLVFLVCMLLYYKSGAHDIPGIVPPGFYPFFLVLYAIKCLILPLRTRRPLWRAIFEVMTSPFNSPTFFTIYIADVFTSMVKVFQDFAFTIGFVVSGDWMVSEDKLKEDKSHMWAHSFWYKNVLIPLICLFPLWIRFNQCLRRYLDTGIRGPNLLNAFKYAMSQTVTLFGAFHPLYLMYSRGDSNAVSLFQIFWMALFVASSLYSFTWDVVMDWGLGQPKFAFLGPRLMYPNRLSYYLVMAADLVLRFMWVLTLIPPQSGAQFEIPQYLTAVSMALELFRRTLWGFFRLENEHRNNTGHYRRVSFVPLHFNTGHKHKYSHEKEHVGWTVLVEVGVVSLIVIGVSVSSVIAAQRASRDLLSPEL